MAAERGSTVALRFRLDALEKAESLAKSVQTTVLKTADLAKDVRQKLATTIKDRLTDIRSLKKNLERTVRLQQRADAIRDRNKGGDDPTFSSLMGFEKTFEGFAGKSLGAFKRNLNDVVKPGNDLLNGDVTGAVEEVVGQFGGVPGKIAAFLTKAVREYVDERIAAETKLRIDAFRTELEEQRYRDDYARRMKDEPGFARAEAARAWELTRAEEARLSENGYTRQSDLLERF